MLPQTVVPLLFAPKGVKFPVRAKEYLFGEYAETQLRLRDFHGKTFELAAPIVRTSSKTIDELIDIANGQYPRGTPCGANLCRNAITEMLGVYLRNKPDKLYYLEFFRHPLPPLPDGSEDRSFYGAGGQDGRFDWTGKDIPEISGMCYTSDHKTWMACGVTAEELEARGWSIPDFAKNRGVRTGGKLHEILHAMGLPHTTDDPVTPEDERYNSIMHNYFNYPQKYAPDDQWLDPEKKEGARNICLLDDEWEKVESIGGLG